MCVCVCVEGRERERDMNEEETRVLREFLSSVAGRLLVMEETMRSMGDSVSDLSAVLVTLERRYLSSFSFFLFSLSF